MNCSLSNIHVSISVSLAVGKKKKKRKTYRRHRSKVSWSKTPRFIVSPDVDLALETEEDIVGFFVVVESDGLIKCTACSDDCEGVVRFFSSHQQTHGTV